MKDYAEGNTYCGAIHPGTGRGCGKHTDHDGPCVVLRLAGVDETGRAIAERIEFTGGAR